MNVETHKRKAFELVTEALTNLDHYKQSKDRKRLNKAEEQLIAALDEDPQYLRALYIKGMVSDLQGEGQKAIDEFEVVLNNEPPFADEVRYNLAVANYHRYSHEYLDKAIELFNKILKKYASDEEIDLINVDGNNLELILLTKAGISQAYAMHMIPPSPENPEKGAIQDFYDKSNQQSKIVISYLDSNKNKISSDIYKEITWTALNAQGMSRMYYVDYFGENLTEKIKMLEEAFQKLEDADKYNGKDWANTCDMGSVQMRLGYWKNALNSEIKKQKENHEKEKDPKWHFEEAIEKLQDVVNSLRPNYGFALYEIGRAYRIQGDFINSKIYFEKALEIDSSHRDVSNRRVEKEISRAENKDSTFP